MTFALPYIYYFFTVFLSIFASKTSKEFNYLARIFFIFITLYFIGLRGFVEADWLIYYPVWNKAPSLFDGISNVIEFLSSTFYEKGFALLLVICKTICKNYLFVQLSIFVFTLICLDKFLSRYCKKYYYLGACLFYLFGGYILSIILIRNCISVMIFLLSVPSLIDRNWKKYLTLNILGCFFHTSSVFYLPLYFLLGIKFSSSLIFFIWFIGNFIFFLQIPVATTVFSVLGEKILGRTGYLIVSYLNSKQYSASYGISIGFIERAFTFLIFFLNRKKFQEKSDLFFLNMLYLYSFVFLYFTDFRIVVDRLPILIYCCYWILYPRLYEILRKETKAVVLALLLFYSVVKIIMFFGTPIGYYENVFRGAMNYEARKTYTLKVNQK